MTATVPRHRVQRIRVKGWAPVPIVNIKMPRFFCKKVFDLPVLKTRGLSPTRTRTRSNIFKDHFDQTAPYCRNIAFNCYSQARSSVPPPPPPPPPHRKDYLKTNPLVVDATYIKFKSAFPHASRAVNVLKTTALYSVKWMKMLWGHLHQIQESWADRNFITTSSKNRLFPHSCKERHQLEAGVDQWFVSRRSAVRSQDGRLILSSRFLP